MKVMVTVFYLLAVQPARENNSVGQIRNTVFCGFFFLRGRSKQSFFRTFIFLLGDLKKKNHRLNLIDKHFTPEEINITML